jgi:hypothetical protein
MLLYFLALHSPGAREEMVKAGVVTTIIDTMKSHPYSAEIQEHACWVIDVLARHDAAHKEHLIQVTSLDTRQSSSYLLKALTSSPSYIAMCVYVIVRKEA